MSAEKALQLYTCQRLCPMSPLRSGILLRRFLGDPTLQGVTHVVIDEVHERSVDTDLSLLLLKDLLARGSPIKVVLMSATANAALFADYYNSTNHPVSGCVNVCASSVAVCTLYTKFLCAAAAASTTLCSSMPVTQNHRRLYSLCSMQTIQHACGYA